MWEPVALPYRNPATVSILPTTEDICACQNFMHQGLTVKVVAVNDHVITKFGKGVDTWEGQALLYLERFAPRVPAPRLYAMYHDSGQLFLVMQRAPGVRLDQIWPSLTKTEKNYVTTQLKTIVADLRQTKCPSSQFFGGLDGGGVRHHLFYSQMGDRKHLGPFCDGPAFSKGLVDNLRALKERNNHALHKVQFYETHLGGALQNKHPVLTHGDLQRQNIMIAETGDYVSEGVNRSFSVMLVDWETAGWYPEYWEYFCASLAFEFVGWDDDWCLHAGRFLPVHLAETAVMRMFEKDWGY